MASSPPKGGRERGGGRGGEQRGQRGDEMEGGDRGRGREERRE